MSFEVPKVEIEEEKEKSNETQNEIESVEQKSEIVIQDTINEQEQHDSSGDINTKNLEVQENDKTVSQIEEDDISRVYRLNLYYISFLFI